MGNSYSYYFVQNESIANNLLKHNLLYLLYETRPLAPNPYAGIGICAGCEYNTYWCTQIYNRQHSICNDCNSRSRLILDQLEMALPLALVKIKDMTNNDIKNNIKNIFSLLIMKDYYEIEKEPTA